MIPDFSAFADRFFAARGLAPASLAMQLDENLSPGYPLCLYHFADGRSIVPLSGAGGRPPRPAGADDLAEFSAVWDFLFEGSLACQHERALGFFLSQLPQDWELGPCRPLKTGDGRALKALRQSDPRSFKLAAVPRARPGRRWPVCKRRRLLARRARCPWPFL
jgi:hypothetical protein